MTLRKEMIAVAMRSPSVLGEATGLILEFLKSQHHDLGGMMNRAGDPDLYYSFFGLECMKILGYKYDEDKWVNYLNQFGCGGGDDLIHLSCLARCWANLSKDRMPNGLRQSLLKQLDGFKSVDGAFNTLPKQEKGSAYGCFVAIDTYHNLNSTIPNTTPVVDRILKVQTPTGAFAFDEGMPEGTTPTTAAAVIGLSTLGYPIEKLSMSREWLLMRRHPQGGLLAVPEAPMPDLLSTATALHTLSKMGENFDDWKESCLDFIDSLWVNKGGFYAHWSDDVLDVEYLFYALLALGHLAD